MKVDGSASRGMASFPQQPSTLKAQAVERRMHAIPQNKHGTGPSFNTELERAGLEQFGHIQGSRDTGMGSRVYMHKSLTCPFAHFPKHHSGQPSHNNWGKREPAVRQNFIPCGSMGVESGLVHTGQAGGVSGVSARPLTGTGWQWDCINFSTCSDTSGWSASQLRESHL